MFRFKIFCRNKNVQLLKQLQQWSIPLERRAANVQSFSTSVNEIRSNLRENTKSSNDGKTDTSLTNLRQLVKEQVG